MSDTHHEEEHAHHFIVPWQYYMVNAVIITVLMALTVFAAKGMDLPGGTNGLNLWLALFIAILKAGFIMAIFMGVKWNSPLVKLFAIGVVGWLMMLLGIMRLWFVDSWSSMVKKHVDKVPVLFSLFGLMIGLLLSYVGFVSHHL